jgi:hypothetical protein
MTWNVYGDWTVLNVYQRSEISTKSYMWYLNNSLKHSQSTFYILLPVLRQVLKINIGNFWHWIISFQIVRKNTEKLKSKLRNEIFFLLIH